MLYSFVWPNYVRDLGGTEREIGLLSSLMFATVAVTLLPGGWLADRVERRALMVVTWGLAAFAPLLYAFARSWRSLIPGAILYNIFLGWPAMEAYIADSVPPEALARAFTLTGAGFSMGAILSPLLGGWLLPIIGMRGLFFMAFALFLLSTAVLALLAPSHPRPRPAVRTMRIRQSRHGFIPDPYPNFGARTMARNSSPTSRSRRGIPSRWARARAVSHRPSPTQNPVARLTPTTSNPRRRVNAHANAESSPPDRRATAFLTMGLS